MDISDNSKSLTPGINSARLAYDSVKRGVSKDPDSILRKGIWIYFILLIFEGALRKWIFPGLATPLLLIRDPLAIWLVIAGWRRGMLNGNMYVVVMFLVGTLAIFTAIFLGHGNILVALYGARVLIVHFPLIFIVYCVFDKEDIIKIGKFMVWLTIPMAILLVFQFYSPQTAWVNRGIGGDTSGGGFEGALNFFRGPTTFSFTTGTALFFGLSACFIFYFWLDPKKHIGRPLLICASIALLMSIPFSISRTLLLSVGITAAFVLLAVSRNPRFFGKVVIITIVLLMMFVGLSQLGIFQTATNAFSFRVNAASDTEGGVQGIVGGRVLNAFLGAYTSSDDIPFFGYGIGMGTNVGSTLLTGKTQFLIAEGEWGRLIGEMGLVMGTIVIFIRLSLFYKIAVASFKRLKHGDFLPWLLLSNTLLIFPQLSWSQPTELGFCVIIAGFTVASTRVRSVPVTTQPSETPVDKKFVHA